MIAIDYLLIAILLLSAVMGIFRGFVKEALSLIGWIVAIWGAWRFGDLAVGWVPDIVEDPMIRLWAGRLVVLIGVLILSGIASGLFSFLMGRSGLDGTDRVIGMIFGLGRGAVLVGVVIYVLQFAGFDADPWWQKSKLIPYAAPIAESLRDIADQGMELLKDDINQVGFNGSNRRGQ